MGVSELNEERGAFATRGTTMNSVNEIKLRCAGCNRLLTVEDDGRATFGVSGRCKCGQLWAAKITMRTEGPGVWRRTVTFSSLFLVTDAQVAA